MVRLFIYVVCSLNVNFEDWWRLKNQKGYSIFKYGVRFYIKHSILNSSSSFLVKRYYKLLENINYNLHYWESLLFIGEQISIDFDHLIWRFRDKHKPAIIFLFSHLIRDSNQLTRKFNQKKRKRGEEKGEREQIIYGKLATKDKDSLPNSMTRFISVMFLFGHFYITCQKICLIFLSILS